MAYERSDFTCIEIHNFISVYPWPSFLVDLDIDKPRICFRNTKFTQEFDFEHPNRTVHEQECEAFSRWAFSQPEVDAGDSINYCRSTWVATTLHNRWKIVQCCTATAKPSKNNSDGAAGELKHAGVLSQLPTGSAEDQFERRLKSYQVAHLNHDWTASNSAPGFSPYVQLLRFWDWSKTPLGPLESWCASLRLMVNLVMVDPNPAIMFWGAKMCGVYNEHYVKIINDKHPQALGEPYVKTWSELYRQPEVGAALDAIWEAGIKDGRATYLGRQPFYLRNGDRLEEKFFNLSLMPIIDESGKTVAFYEPLTDITADYLNERRSENVRKIGELTAGEEDPSEFFQSVVRALEPNQNDFPFAMVYSLRAEASDRSNPVSFENAITTGAAKLVSFLGVLLKPNGTPVVHDVVMSNSDLLQAIDDVRSSGQPALFDLEGQPEIKASIMENPPTRGFGDEPRFAVLVPIEPTTHKGVNAILIVGVNPRRPYDAAYESFIRGLARSISSSLASLLLLNEQKRLAGEAREMEERALAMIEVSPTGSFLMTMEGEILYANPAWYKISGYPHKTFWPMSWLEVIEEDYSEIMAGEWSKLIVDKVSVSFELGVKRPWQSIDPATGAPVHGRTYLIAAASVQHIGGIPYISGAVTDISQQKWVEGLQKQRHQEALELKRQQENFMDMTSHEMRNPLSAIFQCADAIVSTLLKFQNTATSLPVQSSLTQQEGLKGSTARLDDPIAYAIELAGTVTLCAQHQKRIVDDVLVLSKVDANLIEIHPIDVQPRVMIENALKMFAAELAANNAKMSFQVETSFENLHINWVKLDPSRLLQILINVCTNAIKFTMDSKIRKISITLGASQECPLQSSHGVQYLHHSTDQEFADPTARAEWGSGDPLYLHLQVTDTGRGMNPEEMKLLFQRFSQASPRTHTQYGGSGLGLFIARLLCRLQGGEIGVTSQSGQGSTFAFYVKVRRADTPHGSDVHTIVPEVNIPVGVADPKSPSMRAQTQTDPQECSKFNILIVEDNVVNQKVLGKQLRNLGFVVDIANNGRECIDFLERSVWHRNHPHDGARLSVILMDIEMPVMSGIEAVRCIRGMQERGDIVAHVPIIAITANARAEQIAVARAAGMDDVVSKPFRIPELIPKIESFVGPLERGPDTTKLRQ